MYRSHLKHNEDYRFKIQYNLGKSVQVSIDTPMRDYNILIDIIFCTISM